MNDLSYSATTKVILSDAAVTYFVWKIRVLYENGCSITGNSADASPRSHLDHHRSALNLQSKTANQQDGRRPP
jgi:hypothetical protein